MPVFRPLRFSKPTPRPSEDLHHNRHFYDADYEEPHHAQALHVPKKYRGANHVDRE